MNEEIEKYYNILGVNESSTNEEVYNAYMTKRNELVTKKQNNEITTEEYDKSIEELEQAYTALTISMNNLSIKTETPESKTETEQLEAELKKSMEKESPKDITVKRGRLIRKIQAEIKKIKSCDNLSAEDSENLKKLEELLDNEIDNHRHQLKERYKNEFLDKKATIRAIFTVLPKGLGLQVKKISNCINELKQAKSNKERIFGVVDLAKSLGLLVATPVIFTAKFIVEHWYLLLLLLLLLPNLKFPHLNKNNEDNKEYDNPQPEEEVVMEEEVEYGVNPSLEKEPSTVPQPGIVKDPALNPVPKPGLTQEPIHATTPSIEPSIATEGESVVKNPLPNPNINKTPVREPEPNIGPSVITEGESVAKTPLPNPNIDKTPVREPEPNIGPSTIVDSSIASTPTVEKTPDLTVVNSSAKQEYYDLLRQALPADLSANYTVFDTYQEALEYVINEMGVDATEAENILNGKSLIEKPSIMWLVGKGGFFAESQAEMLQNYTTDQLNQIVEDNQDLTNQVVEMNRNGNSVSDIFNNLGTGGLVLFVCYELLQYGLAIPTSGASLLLPG